MGGWEIEPRENGGEGKMAHALLPSMNIRRSMLGHAAQDSSPEKVSES